MTATQQMQDGRASQVPDSPGLMKRLVLFAFMMGMVVPVWIQVGSILLMPHRIVLLVVFVPLFFALISGRAGPIRSFDFLMMASALWAVLSLGVNGSIKGASIPQQMGVYVLEAFGAYLFARVMIRSAADFGYFCLIFFISLLVLVPFGVLEAVLHRPIMLDLIPKSVAVVNMDERWGLRRAQTVFGHPILFGTFCSAGFGLFWYVMGSKLTRVGGTLLSFTGTFVALSSGALVSITMQLIFIVWETITRPAKKRWTVFAILAALTYVLIDLLSNRTPFHVLITYATFSSRNSYNRILIWRFGMENVWENPMFGLGANVDFWSRPEWMSSSADNYWLLLAMQYGIPCFLFAAAALFIIIQRVSLAPLKDSYALRCRAGYLTAVGGLIIAGGTVHYWHGVMAFVMFFFGSGVWAIDAGTKEQADPDPEQDDPETQTLPAGMIYTRQTRQHSRQKPVPASAARHYHRRTGP